MTLPGYAVSDTLAAFFVAALVWYRTRPAHRAIDTPKARPIGHTHEIRAFTLAGERLPDVYVGNSDQDVKRKWDALKQRKNAGHWELWHATHGKRDAITRSLI